MDIFLFNELSGSFKVKKINKMMRKWSKKHNTTTYGMSLIDLEIDKFFERLNTDDRLVVVGGDGTLHYFVNYINDIEVKNDIFYIPNGTGNDFYKSITGTRRRHRRGHRRLPHERDRPACGTPHGDGPVSADARLKSS